MKYYTIDNEQLLIANNITALSKFYSSEVLELPEDYEPNKYIIGDAEIEIDVPDYDKDGNPIMVEVEETITVIDYDDEGNPIGEHEETITKEVPQTHKETVTAKRLIPNPEWDSINLAKHKEAKFTENLTKANAAINDGYVVFKDAQFETNAQTVGDLTATMLMMQIGEIESWSWLSRDDKVVELSIADFITLGNLIAAYKNVVWNEKYITYKAAIEKAKTAEKVDKIVIDYSIPADE